MRVALKRREKELQFTLELSQKDRYHADGQREPIQLMEGRFGFALPVWGDRHPDLLAAALLSVVLPFIGESIEMPQPVSAAFAEVVCDAFAVEITSVSSQLRTRQPGRRPGLAFSGGVDSTAAMLLMPEESAFVFTERLAHPHVSGGFRYCDPALARRFCGILRAQGRDVYLAGTDHEHIIKPYPDWVTWMGVASPLILMADALDLDSLWFGSTLGSWYLPEWNGIHYFPGDPDAPWQRVLSAVGLPIARPVSGVSEVGTASIVHKSPYHAMTTSCAQGSEGQPCLICTKCLRKLLIDAVITGCHLPRGVWHRFSEVESTRQLFRAGPIIHGYIEFMYLFQRLPPIPDLYFSRVQQAMRRVSPDMAFMEHWYPRSLQEIPEKYRTAYLLRKSTYLQDYSPAEVQQLESWDVSPPFHLPPPGLRETVTTQGRRVACGLARRARRGAGRVRSKTRKRCVE